MKSHVVDKTGLYFVLEYSERNHKVHENTDTNKQINYFDESQSFFRNQQFLR